MVEFFSSFKNYKFQTPNRLNSFLMKKNLILLLSGLAFSSAYSQPYQWDTRFGKNGLSFGPNQIWADYTAQEIHLVNDCKAIVGSYCYGPNGESYISLSRYNLSDGSVDANFGDGQESLFRFNFRNHLKDFLVQPDQKIVVAGDDWGSNSSSDFRAALFRLKADGKALDSTFGTNGRLRVESDGISSGGFITPFLLPDGRIQVSGYTNGHAGGGSYSFIAVRVKPDGKMDSTFGINGMYRNFSVGAGPHKSVLYPDGKMLTVVSAGFPTFINFIKLKSNGTADSTFGINGVVETGLGTGQFEKVSFFLQPDGKFLVNFRHPDQNTTQQVARFKVNGQRDSTFGVNGVFSYTFSTLQTYPLVGGLKVLNDGKILASVSLSPSPPSRIVLFRLKSNGQMDSTFGNNGLWVRQIQNSSSITNHEIDNKGNIWLCGQKNNDLSFMTKVTQNPGHLVPVNLGDDTTQCGNAPITLNATTPGATNYLWGNGSNSPTLEVNTNGTYSVWATNSNNKCFGRDTVQVSFIPVVIPTISLSGNFLTTSGVGAFKWYKNNIPIPGQTGSSTAITGPGIYTVTLTINGCTGTSLPFIVTNIESPENQSISIFPNPAINGEVNVKVSSDFLPYQLSSYDLQGKVIEIPETVYDSSKRLKLSQKIDAVVVVKMESKMGIRIIRVVVN